MTDDMRFTPEEAAMSKPDGGPAFPVSTRTENGKRGHQDSPDTWQFPGMTLRDYFAGQALAFLAHPARVGVSFDPEGDAEFAYAVADAMIAAREVDDE